MSRGRLLAVQVEAALAAGDLTLAKEAANELSAVAESLGLPAVRAAAEQARGAVTLADHDARGAMADLRTACADWGALGLTRKGRFGC
jgi:hypothetical protein